MSADRLLADREKVATACRILGARRLVDADLAPRLRTGRRDVDPHPLPVSTNEGVARTTAADVRHIDLDGNPLEAMDGWQVPKELPIHTRLLAERPEMAAVVHAHPPATLIAGLAGLELRAVFGAYNIPAMRLAVDGVPVYDRPILITR